jgi:transcriptional regulator with XRE-family HTH domain
MEKTNRDFLAIIRRAGWTQAEVARAMRTTTATISRYCTGAVEVPPSSLDHLIRIIGQPPDGEASGVRLAEGPRWMEAWESELIGLVRRVQDPARRAQMVAGIRSIVDAIAPPAAIPRPRRKPPDPVEDPLPSTAALIEAAIDGITLDAVPPPPAGAGVPRAGDPPPTEISPGQPAPAPTGTVPKRSTNTGEKKARP